MTIPEYVAGLQADIRELRSQLEQAQRQLAVFRADVEAEDLKRRQKATGNYHSPTSTQGGTNGN